MRRAGLLLFVVALAACQPEEKGLHGYVEGEYVYLAPTSGGVLASLDVARGQNVGEGDPLFSLDPTTLKAQLSAAEAEAARVRAERADLTKGKRDEEIEVLLHQQDQAKASLENAEAAFRRVKGLVGSGAASRADYDARSAELDQAKARVEEIEAEVKTARLGGRVDALKAADEAVRSAEEKVVEAKRKLAESAPVAPKAGRIEDTFFRVGEYVGAGKAVVSLLPPENVKIRFFVPEKELSAFQAGTGIRLSCDGCGEVVRAHVSFVSSESEYTPPVIFSVGSRDKLVYLIEAKPDRPSLFLHPGMPVDIARERPE